jgi:hypothetical protein
MGERKLKQRVDGRLGLACCLPIGLDGDTNRVFGFGNHEVMHDEFISQI